MMSDKNNSMRIIVVMLSWSMVLFMCVVSVGAAPQAILWEFWNVANEESADTVSYTIWNSFLDRYLFEERGIVWIDYLTVTQTDRAALRRQIAQLSAVTVRSLARDEQKAFWINLYNILTVDIVLDNYPIKSIKHIPSQLFPIGPWDKNIITIEGQDMSLNDIEHRILRPIWQDPRTHYAINCASIDCPNIADSAYTAENLGEMLDEAAHEYINHPRAVSIKKNGKLHLSSIYNWFAEDFGGSEAEVIAHLQEYANPALRDRLKKIAEVSSYHYNWSLNDYNRFR